MQADRFVTLCFTYSGLVLLTQYLTIYRAPTGLPGLSQLLVALSILSVGVYRFRTPTAEVANPAEFGGFVYGIAVLSLLLTVIFVAQLVLVR